ncbi:MAG: DUF1684 domain-containing protein [Thermoanaerobaculia bacterium]
MRRSALLVLLLLAIGCGGREPAVDHSAYRAELAAWQKSRADNLRKEGSWLTLAGLAWLKPGENVVGSAPDAAVRLPDGKAPARAGVMRVEDGKVEFVPEPGSGIAVDGKPAEAMTLLADADPEGPTVLTLGSLTFYTIKRADRIGVRVKDSESAARRDFKGLDYYPVDAKWRVTAQLERNPKEIPILNIIGLVENTPSPGTLRFTIDGKEVALDPIVEEGSDELFVIFADETSGTETYGAGRYLYAAMPGGDGKTVLDFNKAYNPPCAFTEFATCPLPPRQNRLPIRVEAGEKKYVGGH